MSYCPLISTRFARICHAIGKIHARIQEICNKDFKRHMILINIESDCLKIVCPLKSLLKISLDPCLAKYSVKKKIRLAPLAIVFQKQKVENDRIFPKITKIMS